MIGTWLGALNWYVLRWFWIRLARVIDTETGKTLRWTILWGIRPNALYRKEADD
jgi:hypothetical protein